MDAADPECMRLLKSRVKITGLDPLGEPSPYEVAAEELLREAEGHIGKRKPILMFHGTLR